jgi:phosphoglycolate phosphatase-like HAD superfamily hydrolase
VTVRGNGEGKPVVALDLDGTLGDYHANFLEFADRYFHSNCGSWFAMREKPNPGLKLWEWMGIEQHEYREAKLAYRQGGWKRWMPAYPGASDLAFWIRSAGAEVWLCTTRPYLRLDNVDPDTREWLRRNDIQYDAVIFDPLDPTVNKYTELYRQAGSRVAAIVDDLPEMIEAADYLRLPKTSMPILRDQPYNRHLYHPRRATSCQEIQLLVAEDLNRWRKSNV